MKFLTFKGNLTTYFETGMEHLGLGLQVEGERFKTPNPQYDGTKEKGPKEYHSLEGLILLRPGDRLEITTPNGLKVLMIGNSRVAKSHQYRLGSAYPKEISDDKQEIMEYLSHFHEEQPATIVRPLKNLAFYGGTFDPIHLGHKGIIEQLHYHFDLVLVLPTNNWTKNNFTFSLSERINAAKAVANNYLNVEVLDWSLQEDTSATFLMFNKIKNLYGIEPKIVIGGDNLIGIERWKNFEQLKTLPFIIIPRGPLPQNILLKNYQVHQPHKWESYSSTEIRTNNLINQIPEESKKELDLTKLIKKD